MFKGSSNESRDNPTPSESLMMQYLEGLDREHAIARRIVGVLISEKVTYAQACSILDRAKQRLEKCVISEE